ncbi:15991_t:CDS:2, partial [Cetraspora pellucida]
ILNSKIEKTTEHILTSQLARYTSAVVPRIGKSDISCTIFSGNEDTISLNIIAIASCNFDKSLSLFDNIDV